MSQNGEQIDISDLGLWFGKMCPEPLVQTAGKTSEQYWKRQSELSIRPPLFLDMRGGGLIAESFWDESGLSLGEYMTCSFGVAPKDVVVSRLSQILEDRPHPKYCLSAKACQGILNRAKKRGKELPKLLEETLIRQSHSKNVQDETGGVKEYSSKRNGQEPCLPLTTKQYSKHQVYGMSPYESNAMKSSNPHSGIYEADTARTLDLNGANPNCNQGGMMVLGIDAHNLGTDENNAMTLLSGRADTHNVPCVAYSQDAYDKFTENDNSASLKACGGTYGGGAKHLLYQEVIGSLCSRDSKGVGTQYVKEGKCVIEYREDDSPRKSSAGQ